MKMLIDIIQNYNVKIININNSMLHVFSRIL